MTMKIKRLKRREFPPEDGSGFYSPAYIVADLMALKDECGQYIAEGDYGWAYQAVMYVREELAKGAVVNAFAAQWCEPGHRLYEEFNARWRKRLGKPV
ncbi:MAG: hypothetical protein JWP34_4741 [Massilia sp.]|nr:hypothetical protein [Massilia sp.]